MNSWKPTDDGRGFIGPNPAGDARLTIELPEPSGSLALIESSWRLSIWYESLRPVFQTRIGPGPDDNEDFIRVPFSLVFSVVDDSLRAQALELHEKLIADLEKSLSEWLAISNEAHEGNLNDPQRGNERFGRRLAVSKSKTIMEELEKAQAELDQVRKLWRLP